jgi:dTDP-4-amino-4,6-dideoxygalactose transaminase
VIIPSFTFIATAHALQWQGITPVFCDVAPGKHHMDPRRVESLITPRTTGIMGVHVWGEVYGIEQLQEIADKHGLRLMFDAAHAFAVSHNGAMVGSFGEAEVLSFHATKFFNSLEGGAITTNNDDIAEKARFMRDFGFAGYDQVDYIGTNGKMNEISAAMGLTSLESLPEFVDVNKRNYQTYQHELTGLPGIRLFEYDKTERRNYQYIVVEVDQNQTGISRDSLVEILHAENVLARRYFYPGCHKMEPYRSLFPHAGLLLPETERLTTRVMSLPNGTSVNTSDVEQICALIHFLVENGEAITARLLQ